MTPFQAFVEGAVARETDGPGVESLGNVPLDPVERPATDKQNILGIERDQSLIGVLAPATRSMEAMEAATPVQIVETSLPIYCIVS